MVTEHKDGGYTLDGNEIGMILTVVAVVQIPFQVSKKKNHFFHAVILCITHMHSYFSIRLLLKQLDTDGLHAWQYYSLPVRAPFCHSPIRSQVQSIQAHLITVTYPPTALQTLTPLQKACG